MQTSIKGIIQHKGFAGFLAIALVSIAVFFIGNRPTLYILDEEKLSDAPDFFLENVTTRSYDSDGKALEVLQAQAANHYLEKKTALEQPIVTRYTDNLMSITSAESGLLHDQDNTASFNVNAKVIRYADNVETGRIQADTLFFNNNNQTFISHGNSELITPQGITQSVSIFFNLTDNTATLNGGVSGRYEVSK
ncbi:MAG: LPS export ABC transporter periplasmic protein LptC [Pseudomonadota bacterium]|nr:LPS export ABC transporter periplasmic protein LptC [Pseudomonadota bacterium]